MYKNAKTQEERDVYLALKLGAKALWFMSWGDITPEELDEALKNIRKDKAGNLAARYCKTETKPEVDMVNHPPHYQRSGVEAIDVIRTLLSAEEYRGYCRGNIIKYAVRDGRKAGCSKEQDRDKAQWYLDEMLRSMAANS